MYSLYTFRHCCHLARRCLIEIFAELASIHIRSFLSECSALGLKPSGSPRPLPIGIVGHINLPEPKDLHLREQGLGSCLQSLPTVCFCQCLTDQVSNQFYLAFSCFILLRDFLFPISTGLEPMPSNPIWLACSPPTPDV